MYNREVVIFDALKTNNEKKLDLIFEFKNIR